MRKAMKKTNKQKNSITTKTKKKQQIPKMKPIRLDSTIAEGVV